MSDARSTAGHERCGADTSTDENPDSTCGLPAGWGTEHKGIGRCRKHLGNTRNHVESARRQQTMALAAEYLDNPDAMPMRDVGDAMLRLATRVEMAVDAVGARVNDLTAMRYSADGAGTEQVRGEVQVWVQLIARFESLLKNIGQLKLDERRVQLSEDQGALIVQALEQVFTALELTEVQRGRVPVVVPPILRAIGEGGTPPAVAS
ncbi:MAG: hypothetical protein JWP31_1816 [Aeromicrobium sp.]|nr:hypothetical protein [Aeromicrobium sp.]